MKRVVTPQEVAHLFANQLQSDATNSNRSLYFNNDKIYSYGNHFCIAKFIDSNTLLFTERSYSSTTSGHISIVRSATSHINKIYCAYPTGTHEQNFTYWLNECESITDKLKKANKPEIYLTQLNQIKDKANVYANYFKIEVPLQLIAVLSVTNKKEVVDYLENKKELIDAENKAKEVRKTKEHKEQLVKWRKNKIQRLILRNGYDYIRKNGNDFETSQGVKIPFEVGMRFYSNLNNVKVGSKFLDFTVSEVTKKFISIGCHKITIAEIKKAVKV